jgi:hypothetical protein
MNRENNGNIVFMSKNQVLKKRKDVDFVPNDAVRRVLKSNHSDINELKSYLHPRGKKY